jgi:ribosomal protein S6
MKDYELTYLIALDLSEQEVKDLSDKVRDFIQQEEGKIERLAKPSKRRLGYPIREKSEVFLISLDFSLAPEKLVTLENKLKSENQILRYIITIKEKVSEIDESISKKPRPVLRPGTPGKVELKEIDKKIEEILNE